MSSLTVQNGGGFVWEDDRRHWEIFNITNNNNIEKQGIARLNLYPFLKTWYSTLMKENWGNVWGKGVKEYFDPWELVTKDLRGLCRKEFYNFSFFINIIVTFGTVISLYLSFKICFYGLLAIFKIRYSRSVTFCFFFNYQILYNNVS